MLEKYNGNDIVVRDYTDNFSIKEYYKDKLIPQMFPDIPINKLNLGMTGIISEQISNATEDAFATSVLMLNENFITRQILPNSIYSEASLFDLGYTFATPSVCNFALEIWLDDILKYSTKSSGNSYYEYKLDKDTKIILDKNIYRLDYDILIRHRYINGKPAFEVQYDIDDSNSISIVGNRFIRCVVTNNGWLVLFLTLQEFERVTDEDTISDNVVTSNSDITISWSGQIAGLDLTYITPTGESLPMKKKIQYSDPEQNPFVYYSFHDDNTIKLTFSINKGFFRPEFNSKLAYTIYVCNGKSSNFDTPYGADKELPVEKTDKYEYNANTRIVARCYSSSTLGRDKGDIEVLRSDVKLAYNTVNVLSTDHDLDEWFDNFAMKYDTRAYFFKRRDDPSGRLFSQFVAITDNSYIYPTNTLSIEVNSSQFDFINNNNEFIIKPGHVWEYKEGSRDTVVMCKSPDEGRMSFITDDVIPQITSSREFMFVNPFYIKINRIPAISALYNYLIHDTSYPIETYINNDEFLHFQLSNMSIDRTISKKYHNKYIIRVLCTPIVNESTLSSYKYIQGTVYDNPNYSLNNLRIVMVTKTSSYGETGYIEMYPVSVSEDGSISFEAVISVMDNLKEDNLLEIDQNETDGMHSLLLSGSKAGQILIDASKTRFDFIVLIKPTDGTSSSTLYENPTYTGYTITSRFENDYRNLVLYKPMTMMRSVILFAGDSKDYTIRASLMPFLKYDIPLNEQKMSYFIEAFTEQYAAVEPVLFERLDNNCSLDFKLFNTYGKSNNYYVGDPADEILLDSVHLKIQFKLYVIDRNAYAQTAELVTQEIKKYFEALNTNKLQNVYISNLIKIIETNNPNVDHLNFLGINNYGPNKWDIVVKYDDISDLKENEMFIYVPEMILIDESDIILIEGE